MALNIMVGMWYLDQEKRARQHLDRVAPGGRAVYASFVHFLDEHAQFEIVKVAAEVCYSDGMDLVRSFVRQARELRDWNARERDLDYRRRKGFCRKTKSYALGEECVWDVESLHYYKLVHDVMDQELQFRMSISDAALPGLEECEQKEIARQNVGRRIRIKKDTWPFLLHRGTGPMNRINLRPAAPKNPVKMAQGLASMHKDVDLLSLFEATDEVLYR